MCVVALLGLVLDVSNVNGNTALGAPRGAESIIPKSRFSFRSGYLSARTLEIAGGQGGLTVVNVTNGTDVNVRLGALELSLSQECSS